MIRVIMMCFFLLSYMASAIGQKASILLKYDKNIKDYSPIIKDAIKELTEKGGGTLIVPYGDYPVLTGVIFESHRPSLILNIVGRRNALGQLPTFFDRDKSKKPHIFFWFIGDIANPRLTINVSNIQVIGNNFPYYKGHPFYEKGATPCPAFRCSNILTANFSNVIIKNVYGDGIALINGFDNHNNDKKNRIEAPIIKDCQILNCWSWNGKNDGGDGIMLWSVNNPIIENCIILNNINTTKHYGRCGIVLEHYTEKAIIRNNKIGGYERNMHIECDYGGHLIERNTFSQSKIGITLSEACNQDPDLKHLYFPIKILNNIFEYRGEMEKNNLIRNDFGYISIHKKSFMLEGLTIKNNRFLDQRSISKGKIIHSKDLIKTDKKVFMKLDNQDGVIILGNKYD